MERTRQTIETLISIPDGMVFVSEEKGKIVGMLGLLGPTRKAYAIGKAEQEALELGSKFTKNVGNSQREFLKQFRKMTDAQKDLARLGVARKIMDDIENTDRIQSYLSVPAVRAIREVFGKKHASRLLKQFRIEQQTKNTNNAFQGSRTTPLAEANKKAQEDANIIANAATGNAPGTVKAMTDRVKRGITQRNANELARLWTTTDKKFQDNILRQLSKSQRDRLRRLLREQTIANTGSILAERGVSNVLGIE
ncbi:MAG: hypothetical protein AAF228_13260 [Pseudomonadota bacterium]